MYRLLIKPFIQRMDLETASGVALQYFRILGKIPGGRFLNRLVHNNKESKLQREVFGLNFYNPIGLGAGLDRHGVLYNDLNDLGFSFSEIGPFDAKGIKKAIRNIQKDPQDDILAACIRKDYLTAFTLAYDFCDFFVMEIDRDYDIRNLEPLLDARLMNDNYKPIVIKISPDINPEQLDYIVKYCLMNGFDGIQARSLEQVREISRISGGKLPIVANGEIKTPEDALEMLSAGADLIEVRAGFVYEGPRFITGMIKYLENHKENAEKAES
ncbi:MAG: hypothetical protein MJY69_01295 [Bacteroidales bacterium]|nr:hypothetical protein [Bacteroidales bacterium]